MLNRKMMVYTVDLPAGHSPPSLAIVDVTYDPSDRDEMACESQGERQQQPHGDKDGCCPGAADKPPEPQGANLIDRFTPLHRYQCATAQGGEVSAPPTGHGPSRLMGRIRTLDSAVHIVPCAQLLDQRVSHLWADRFLLGFGQVVVALGDGHEARLGPSTISGRA